MNNDINSKNFFISAMLGFELEFFTNFSREETARKISKEIGKKVLPFNKYHSKFVPTRDVFKIEPDFSGGKKMMELITGPMPYFEAIPVLIRILGWIDKNGWTDKKAAFQFGINFDPQKYPTLPKIQDINKLKFILGFDEDMIWSKFPERKGSLYAKTIRRIQPVNKFLGVGPLYGIDKNMYKVPVEKNMGINFTKLDSGYFEVRYLGGTDYQKKYKDIKDVIDYIISYTQQILSNNELFTRNESHKLEETLRGMYESASSFIDIETFNKNYPNLHILVDLKEDPQILRSFFNAIREKLFNLIVENSVTDGFLNYDSQFSKYQLKDTTVDNAVLLEDIDLVDCNICGNINKARIFGCKISGSHIESSQITVNNEIRDSKIVDSELAVNNTIIDCYIDINHREIACKVQGGIIRSGYIGKEADISRETEIVDEKRDSKKDGTYLSRIFIDRNYKDAEKPENIFPDINGKPGTQYVGISNIGK